MTGQNFIVKPQGAVHGGSAAYTLDPSTGAVVYQATITVGFWPFYHTENIGPKTYPASPALFLPQAWNEAGKAVSIGDANFQVISVSDGVARVQLTVSGQPDLSATALVDVTKPLVDLISVTALYQTSIVGELQIELDEVIPHTVRIEKREGQRFREWLSKVFGPVDWDGVIEWKSLPHR